MYLKYFCQNTCCIFCILTTKYKIQYKQSCTTTTRHVQCKVTMSHDVQRTYCTKRFSAVDIVPRGGKIASGIFIRQRPDRKIAGYYSVTRTNNASDINPPLMNALNLLSMKTILRNF